MRICFIDLPRREYQCCAGPFALPEAAGVWPGREKFNRFLEQKSYRMFGISLPELVVVVVLILVVMGPEKIPDIARTLGKVMREVRRASNMMRDTLMIDEDEYQRNRARRVRQVEREAAEADKLAADSGETVAVVPKRASTLGPMMPGGSLDQIDDEMLTASFEAALSEMYGPADGGLRRVPIAEQRHNDEQSKVLRPVTLPVQGAAPGCRDVHLTVGETSKSEVAG